MEASEAPPLVFKKYRRTTPGERVQWVRRYLSSGLTHRGFCSQHGVSTTALAEWLRQVRRQQEQAGQATPAQVSEAKFEEVSLGAVMGSARWVGELKFPSGTVLRLTAEMPPELLDRIIKGVIC